MIEQFKAISPQLMVNEPMKKHTTFKIGGNADMFVSIERYIQPVDIYRIP